MGRGFIGKLLCLERGGVSERAINVATIVDKYDMGYYSNVARSIKHTVSTMICHVALNIGLGGLYSPIAT